MNVPSPTATIDLRPPSGPPPPPPPPPPGIQGEARHELADLSERALGGPKRYRLCIRCEEPLPAAALNCPNCGADMRFVRPVQTQPQRTDRLSRVVAVLLRFLLLGALLVTAALGSTLLWKGDAIAPRAAVRSTLVEAARAAQFYEGEHGHMTRNESDLEIFGLRMPPDVRLAIFNEERGFCIEARHARLDRTWHITAGRGEPMRGGCS